MEIRSIVIESEGVANGMDLLVSSTYRSGLMSFHNPNPKLLVVLQLLHDLILQLGSLEPKNTSHLRSTKISTQLTG